MNTVAIGSHHSIASFFFRGWHCGRKRYRVWVSGGVDWSRSGPNFLWVKSPKPTEVGALEPEDWRNAVFGLAAYTSNAFKPGLGKSWR